MVYLQTNRPPCYCVTAKCAPEQHFILLFVCLFLKKLIPCCAYHALSMLTQLRPLIPALEFD